MQFSNVLLPKDPLFLIFSKLKPMVESHKPIGFPPCSCIKVTLADLLANCKHGRFSGRNFRG
jgi:hypothetical protein